MSRFGTGLSRLLYAAMLVGMGLMLLAALFGAIVTVVALVDPSVFEGLRARINGQDVFMRQPELALTVGLVMMVACTFFVAVLWQLVGLLRSAASGQPFTADNVRRLRILAALFATMMLVQLSTLIMPAIAQDLLNARELRLDLGTLFAALLSLVLAEVFRAGVALREDVEGTI